MPYRTAISALSGAKSCLARLLSTHRNTLSRVVLAKLVKSSLLSAVHVINLVRAGKPLSRVSNLVIKWPKRQSGISTGAACG